MVWQTCMVKGCTQHRGFPQSKVRKFSSYALTKGVFQVHYSNSCSPSQANLNIRTNIINLRKFYFFSIPHTSLLKTIVPPLTCCMMMHNSWLQATTFKWSSKTYSSEFLWEAFLYLIITHLIKFVHNTIVCSFSSFFGRSLKNKIYSQNCLIWKF